jgi:hypothetical protein
VYLGGYESPPPNTLLGGCVLVVALAIHRLFSHDSLFPNVIEEVMRIIINTYVFSVIWPSKKRKTPEEEEVWHQRRERKK